MRCKEYGFEPNMYNTCLIANDCLALKPVSLYKERVHAQLLISLEYFIHCSCRSRFINYVHVPLLLQVTIKWTKHSKTPRPALFATLKHPSEKCHSVRSMWLWFGLRRVCSVRLSKEENKKLNISPYGCLLSWVFIVISTRQERHWWEIILRSTKKKVNSKMFYGEMHVIFFESCCLFLIFIHPFFPSNGLLENHVTCDHEVVNKHWIKMISLLFL